MANRLRLLAMTGLMSMTALASRGADAKCAMTELIPSLITDKAATVPGDGGVLVGYTTEVGRDEAAPADPSLPGWKFSVEVDHATLAPGLTVYRPKSGAAVAISDAKGKAIARFKRAGAATTMVLPPPMPKTLVITASRSGRGMRRQLTATLSVPAPDTAVAVILYSTKDGKALSFGRITTVHPTAVVPWSDPSRCSFNPPGTAPPSTGDKLVLAYVDQYGRIGATSAALGFSEVKGGKGDDD